MDKISALKKLKGLLEQGIITEEEFARQKKLILNDGKEISSESNSSIMEAEIPADPAMHDSDVRDRVDYEAPTEKAEEAVEELSQGSVEEQKEEGDNDFVWRKDFSQKEEGQSNDSPKDGKDIDSTKAALTGGIVVFATGIIIGVISLFNHNLVDRVVKYEKAGFAVLNVQKDGPEPYAIVMNNEGLYYDNGTSAKKIIPVGNIETQDIALACTSNGLSAGGRGNGNENILPFSSSKEYHAVRISPKSFLLTPKGFEYDPMNGHDISLKNSYLIISRQDKATVIRLPIGKTDGLGNYCWREYRNILDSHGDYFKKKFSKSDFEKFKNRQYGHYVAEVELSLTTGKPSVISVNFDKLNESFKPSEVGTEKQRQSLYNTAYNIFRKELEDTFYKNAGEAVGNSNRDDMRISPDDKYTFVIYHNESELDKKVSLYMVNNKTRKVTYIDSGLEIEFLDNSIHVRKRTWFLIILEDFEDVYYNYSGDRTSR